MAGQEPAPDRRRAIGVSWEGSPSRALCAERALGAACRPRPGGRALPSAARAALIWGALAAIRAGATNAEKEAGVNQAHDST
jgi:hypothetical protein